ncbi:MAG TPA: phosphoribosylanthranilate isomerase [Acidimicrobiales bacterium]|nr:phosphoribosylanthranilate isomerase [Acidimicrobiales bacterium]
MTFVKICGTTSESDALLAVAMGADAVGFVFAPSPRQVAAQLVRDIVRRLPPEVLTVGVFRDEAPERVVSVVDGARLKAAQLHGRETAEQTRWVKERVSVVLKGFAAGHPSIARVADYGADMVLVDGASPGSGKVFDWSLAEDVPAGQRLVIAGGLTPDNVAEAIARVRPFGVDVASGVESRPGHKDARLVRAFVSAAKAAARPDWEAGTDAPYDWQDLG